MELPTDVLAIIRDFSRPVTRPDWRTLRPLQGHILYKELHHVLYNLLIDKPNKRKPLYMRAFNHLKKTEWGIIHIYIRSWGIQDASYYFKIPVQELCKIPGSRYADQVYIKQTYFHQR
jgi:hypothetical protein